MKRFMVTLPWDSLQIAPLREGLVTLTGRIEEEGALRERATHAYVVLRRILLMQGYTPPGRTLKMETTVTGYQALRAELPGMFATELEESHRCALAKEEERLKKKKVPIPPEETVRRVRQYKFGR